MTEDRFCNAHKSRPTVVCMGDSCEGCDLLKQDTSVVKRLIHKLIGCGLSYKLCKDPQYRVCTVCGSLQHKISLESISSSWKGSMWIDVVFEHDILPCGSCGAELPCDGD